MRRLGAVLLLGAWAGVGCGPGQPAPTVVTADPIDTPLKAASAAEVERFFEGDRLFDLPYREADGLGPLYVRTSCGACHTAGGRGPGAVQKMVVVEADGVTRAADQSALTYGHTERPYVTAGAHTPLLPPEGVPVLVTRRAGPPVFGRGYLEAVADAEVERVAAEQAARTDGIHGRIHRVTYQSEPNPDSPFNHAAAGQQGLVGRFGLKARIATLDEFTADAFQGDMGLTSPLRPSELPNPDGLTDDALPGVDVPLGTVNVVADYVRLVEIPARTPPAEAGAQVVRGEQLFRQVRCAVCHVPTLRTRADYPLPALAGIDAPVYTDLLLHDLGEGLADGMVEGEAGPRDWKTAPLIGLRHLRAFLHDGRATTLEEAVLAHDSAGSEASPSVADFRALSDADRAALLAFLETL